MYRGKSMSEEASNTSMQAMSTQPVNKVTEQPRPDASSREDVAEAQAEDSSSQSKPTGEDTEEDKNEDTQKLNLPDKVLQGFPPGITKRSKRRRMLSLALVIAPLLAILAPPSIAT